MAFGQQLPSYERAVKWRRGTAVTVFVLVLYDLNLISMNARQITGTYMYGTFELSVNYMLKVSRTSSACQI